jgi:hypothetical protein
MANGDDAAAAGYDLVAGTADLRMGWDELNKSRDYTARVGTAKADVVHTHTSAQISDASSTNTPSTIVKRASNGQFAVAEPLSASHVATKNYVDTHTFAAVQPFDGLPAAVTELRASNTELLARIAWLEAQVAELWQQPGHGHGHP